MIKKRSVAGIMLHTERDAVTSAKIPIPTGSRESILARAPAIAQEVHYAGYARSKRDGEPYAAQISGHEAACSG